MVTLEFQVVVVTEGVKRNKAVQVLQRKVMDCVEDTEHTQKPKLLTFLATDLTR